MSGDVSKAEVLGKDLSIPLLSKPFNKAQLSAILNTIEP
jgi:hypothetical protein